MSFANYKWSSSLTWFSALTKVDKRTAIDILAHLSAEAAPWKTDLDFRTAISFSHELVHYYQDMLTGVGHWDFVNYRNLIPKAYMWAKQLLTITHKLPFNNNNIFYEVDPYYKYCYDEFLKVYENHSKEFVGLENYFKTATTRKLELTNYINNNFKDKIIFNNDDELLIENIFESEAVATVHLTFLDLKKSAQQYEIYNRNDFLILPHKMDSTYNRVIAIMLSFVNEVLEGTTSSDIIYKTALSYLLFLVDIAAAYPTKEIIQNSKLPKDEFKPVIKFLRLLNSLHTINEKQGQRFSEAFMKNNSNEAEQVLLENCEVDYPHSTKIYSDWLKVFEGLKEETDDILIQLRLNACKNRIQSSSASFNRKNLSQLVFYNLDIPINFLTQPAGITMYTMNAQLDDTFRKNLLYDLIKWNSDLKLFDLFYITGEFSCPLAEANVCSVAEEHCFQIKSLNEIPGNNACLMKKRISPFNI